MFISENRDTVNVFYCLNKECVLLFNIAGKAREGGGFPGGIKDKQGIPKWGQGYVGVFPSGVWDR